MLWHHLLNKSNLLIKLENSSLYEGVSLTPSMPQRSG
jgi:hypothetical protein